MANDITPSGLAETIKAWKRERDLTTAQAAELLGLPKRTLDEVVNGRGFRYPRLLTLAMKSTFD
jgi:transcriptional regulator with XRE-family HTH domain